MSKSYTFKKTDTGYLGKAFELSVKDALSRKNADKVSPCGRSDFQYNYKHYDVKQNGSIIQYAPGEKYIKGSSRVIYASHIAYQVITETADEVTISIDLGETELLVVERQAFIDFLLSEKGLAKYNSVRKQVNIQTGYNYTKKAYHGRVGKRIEEWARNHEAEEANDIIGAILEACD